MAVVVKTCFSLYVKGEDATGTSDNAEKVQAASDEEEILTDEDENAEFSDDSSMEPLKTAAACTDGGQTAEASAKSKFFSAVFLDLCHFYALSMRWDMLIF